MVRRVCLDDLYELAVPGDPALSRDASTVAYVLARADRESDLHATSLWSIDVDADGARPRRLTAGPHDTAPAWSPDGTALAFLRADNRGVAQVWLLPVGGGEPRQLTELAGGCGRPVWNPAGTAIAVAAPVSVADFDAAAPVVIERIGELLGTAAHAGTHLCVVDVADGRVRRLTDGDLDVSTPVWSPDGSRLAVGIRRRGSDLHRELSSAAYVVKVSEPTAPVPVGDDKGFAEPVCWTPDATALLAVGRATADPGNLRLLRIPIDGGPSEDLSARYDRNVMTGAPAYPGGRPAVTSDGSAAVVCVRDGGRTVTWRIDLATGERVRLIDGADQVVSGLSVAGDRAVVVVSDARSFGEIAVLELDGVGLRVLTTHTQDALPGVELFPPQGRQFRAADGTPVEGWLISDPAVAGPAPLVLDVHGGPHNAWTPALTPEHLYHQILAATGISVLTLNPRGSDGYGEQFLTAAIGRWGVADEGDLLGPVQQLVDEGLADPDRLGLCGYSYGGYMTCYLTGRTRRFAAAVAGGVVADLRAAVATADDGHSLALECLAPPHGDADALRAQSPIERVGAVRTPTLILHGAGDLVCPRSQAEQWFAELRERGVPTTLVLYPDAGHAFIVDGRPSHRIDYAARLVGWLTHRLCPERLAERPPTAVS